MQVQGDSKISEVKTTEDTLYYIASVTKSFTATTLLSVLESVNKDKDPGDAGFVTLRTRLVDILPGDFALGDDYATAHATLDDALAHVLGTADHNLSYGGAGYTLRDAVRSLRHLSAAAELRQEHRYLNLGYMVLQHAVQTLAGGRDIADLHRQRIWAPLGMRDTHIRLADARASPRYLARGYTWDQDRDRLLESPWTDDYPLVGGGGIISTIRDMTTYLSAVIHNRLGLSPSSYAELFRPRAVDKPEGPYDHMSSTLYAAGWSVATYRGRRLATHNGGIFGFSSKLLFLPDHNWGVALLTNADINGAFANEMLAMRLLDDFLGVAPAERQDLVPLFRRRLRSIAEEPLETRRTLYPHVPDPPLPTTLPLADYAGSYHNAGYRTIEFKLSAPRKELPWSPAPAQVLHADVRRLAAFTIDLEHVSGDFFAAWYDTETGSPIARAAQEAQFEVGIDGRVKRLKLGMDPLAKDPNLVVWFDRVD